MTLSELAQRGARRYGLAGSIWRAMMLACRVAGRVLYLRERHIWYRLDLSCDQPRIKLPTGLELVRVNASEPPLLEQLGTVGLLEARRRLASGADLWIVREGRHIVFSCWIFRHRTPVLAAPGGWLALPAGTVSLEDSVTSPYHRGRGVAPGAWSGVADALMQESVAAIITKVEEENIPCRRAVEKVGFRAVASMSLVRVWLKPYVVVRPEGRDEACAFLIERLTNRRCLN